MSLQRLYGPVGFATKNYPVPSFAISIPLLSICSGTMARPVTITWDPVKTSVISSRFVIKAHAKADPTNVYVNFNDVRIKTFFWGEGTRCTEQSDVIDVPINNGSNKVEVSACKNFPWLGVVGVDVDVYIEVSFEGETPDQPWWEILQEWVAANWLWLAVGTVIIGGASYWYIARPRGR